MHEPHRIAFYLYDLAAALHALWNRGNDDPSRRFLLVDAPEITSARLALADAIGQIIRSGGRHGGRCGRGDALMTDADRGRFGLGDEDRLPQLEAVEDEHEHGGVGAGQADRRGDRGSGLSNT